MMKVFKILLILLVLGMFLLAGCKKAEPDEDDWQKIAQGIHTDGKYIYLEGEKQAGAICDRRIGEKKRE